VKGGRLLDVGCASGSFLEEAAAYGWEVTGVEPSREHFEIAREKLAGKGTLICNTLQEAGLARSSFDVLTLWDVLEHVPDPGGFMARCASFLRPGGYLFLNVPDLDSLPARLLRERWPLFLPEHLNYFNRSSLRACGERANLVWRNFGRRWASFSLEYVLYRLSQHAFPGAALAHHWSQGRYAGRIMVSIPLGELWGAWQAR
jgi:SAM-dependent methyltransferase